jgi:hypothetical protein
MFGDSGLLAGNDILRGVELSLQKSALRDLEGSSTNQVESELKWTKGGDED